MTRTAAALSLFLIALSAMPAYGQGGKPKCAYYPFVEKASAAHLQLLREFQRTRQCSLIPRMQRTIRQLAIHLERGYRICGNIHFPPEIGRQAAIDVEKRLRPMCR